MMIDAQPDAEKKTIESIYGIWEEWWDGKWVMWYKPFRLLFNVERQYDAEEGDSWFISAETSSVFTIKGVDASLHDTWDSTEQGDMWFNSRDDAIKAVDDAIEGMIRREEGTN